MNVAETPTTDLINSVGSAQQAIKRETSLELSCMESSGTPSAQPSMSIGLLTPKEKQQQQQQSHQQLSPHQRNSDDNSSGHQRRPSSTLSTTESADSGCSFGGSSPINFTANRSATEVFDGGCANAVTSSAGAIKSSASPSSSLSYVSTSPNSSTSRHHNDSPTSRQRLLAELNAFVTQSNCKYHGSDDDGVKNLANSSGAVSLLSPPTTIITDLAENSLSMSLQERQQQQKEQQQQCLLLAPQPLQQQHERGRNLLGRRTASTNAMKALCAVSNASDYAPTVGGCSEPSLLISSNSTPCLFDANTKMQIDWELQQRYENNGLTMLNPAFHRNASPLANELCAAATAAASAPFTSPSAAFSDITQYINPEIHSVQVPELAAQQQQKQSTVSKTIVSLTSGGDVVAHHRQPSPARQQQQDTYKTVMCQAWLESTRCSFGENCKFAHGEMELRPVKVQARNNGKYKTKLCEKYTTTGICPYGSRCLFIHPIPNGNNNNKSNNNTKVDIHRPSLLFQKTQSSIQFPIFATNNNSLSTSSLTFERSCRNGGDASLHNNVDGATHQHERRWLTDDVTAVRQPCDAMISQHQNLAPATAECQHYHHHHHFRSSSMSSMMLQMSSGKPQQPQICNYNNKICGAHHQPPPQKQRQQIVNWSEETIDVSHKVQQPPAHHHQQYFSSSSRFNPMMKPVIGRGETGTDCIDSAFLSRHILSANDEEFEAATLHVPKSSFRPFQRSSTTNHFFSAATSTAAAAAATPLGAAGNNGNASVFENNNSNRLYRPAPVSWLRRLNSANTIDHSAKCNNNSSFPSGIYSASTTSSSSNGLFDAWPPTTMTPATAAIVAHHNNVSGKLGGTAASCLSLLSSSSGLSDNNENNSNVCNCRCMHRSTKSGVVAITAASNNNNNKIPLTRGGIIASTLEKIPSLSLSDENFLAHAEAENATADINICTANMVTATSTASVGFEQLYNTLDHIIIRNHHNAKNKGGKESAPESSIQHDSIGDLVREMELQNLEEYLIASERRMAMERPRQQYPYYCFDDGDHHHQHHHDPNNQHHHLENNSAVVAHTNTEKWATRSG